MLAGEPGGLTLEDARRNQHRTPPPKAALPVKICIHLLESKPPALKALEL